jgi:hypothetical protein
MTGFALDGRRKPFLYYLPMTTRAQGTTIITITRKQSKRSFHCRACVCVS